MINDIEYPLYLMHRRWREFQSRRRFVYTRDITPVSGAFECVQWIRNSDDDAQTYTVLPNTEQS